MAGFDGSVLKKPLDAEERAKQEDATFRQWVSRKLDDIKCVLMGKRGQ